jgi:hypothetical protein
MMVSYDLIPGWFLIIILAREFIVTGLRTLASAKGVIIAADRWGKLKTALQMTFLAIGGLSWINFLGFSVHKQPFSWFWWGFMGIVMLITISSGLGYFIKYKKLPLMLGINTVSYKDSSKWLERGLLEQFVKSISGQVDYVIIDTSPMSVSSDTEAIAGAADAAIMVLKVHESSAKQIIVSTVFKKDKAGCPGNGAAYYVL